MSDPTADFLAREKAALGDDADLFAAGDIPSAPSGVPDITSPVSASASSPPKPSGIDAFPALDDDLLGGGSSAVRVTGTAGLGENPELEKFEAAFPDISAEVVAETTAKPVFNALAPQPYGASPYPPAAGSGAAPRSASSILPAPQFSNTLPETEEDTEPIKLWREQQAKDIEARNAKAQEQREEMAAKAEKDIDQFYTDYNAQKEKTIRQNKEQEAKFSDDLEADLQKLTWERVTLLLGLENSQSKTIRPNGPGGADLSRMKEILLSLRREGEKAPGATGL